MRLYLSVHPLCLIFDSPFSNFCQKKGTLSKKRHRVKKKAFLEQNLWFLSKKGTLSKKRHPKKTFLVTNLSSICQSFIENYMTIKKGFPIKICFPLYKRLLFYCLFLLSVFLSFFCPFWCPFFYFLPKFFTKLRKGVVKVPFLRS